MITGDLQGRAAAAPAALGRGVTAVLGPTNTGKTHYAIERMLAHRSGAIGLPLRLLAREIYDRVCAARGPESAALITGEEKIVPRAPQYWISTVEAMPLDIGCEFLAIDEIQLCADADRGHIFTHRLLHARGTHETVLLGSDSMRPLIQRLLPGCRFISRPRYSDLAYTGEKKLTRLPRRSAIVAFSADQVYAIAELVRRQRGGAAVVMGALSPRTRNAQVALYQSGEVDFLVATDAIGMGLNMDVDHVAFAATSKFDGQTIRPLKAPELAQIAGRAGRYMNDGTFGITAEASALDQETVEAIENHRFDPVRVIQWRNAELDFGSLPALERSLDMPPPARGLAKARAADDVLALRILSTNAEVTRFTSGPAGVKRLWEVCQVPDFRKLAVEEHAKLLTSIYLHLMSDEGVIAEDWIAGHVNRLDSIEGEIDQIAQRIAHIRTWTYCANRPGWLKDPAEWQGRTRAIEDKLSDALHEKLTQRFIDRRTSVLMRRLRADDDFAATVEDGEVLVDGEYVGRLEGFRFVADPRAEGIHGKAIRSAALRGLGGEIASRARRFADAPDRDLTLTDHGKIWWEGGVVAHLAKGADALWPRIVLQADDWLTGADREKADERVNRFIADMIFRTLEPLTRLRAATLGEPKPDDPTALLGPARGMAYRLVEALGSLDRAIVAEEVKALPQDGRAKLRTMGVRFGERSVFLPVLLKPAQARLRALLWAVHQGMGEVPAPPGAGLTTFARDPAVPAGFYEAAGFRVLGPRCVRLDILERLSDLFRSGGTLPEKPKKEASPRASDTGAAETASGEAASGEALPDEADSGDTASGDTASGAAAFGEAESTASIAEESAVAGEPDTTDLAAGADADVASDSAAIAEAAEQSAGDATADAMAEPLAAADGATDGVSVAGTAQDHPAAPSDASPADPAGPGGAGAKPQAKRPDGFTITPQMLSLAGTGTEEFAEILKALNFRPVTTRDDTGTEKIVWRMRHRGPDRPRFGERKDGAQRHEGDRGPRRFDRGRGRDGAAGDARDGKPDGGRPDGGKSGDRRSGSDRFAARHGEKGERGGEQGGRPQADRRDGRDRGRDGRKPGRDDRREERRDMPERAAQAPRERKPEPKFDPNSPFAVLAKLKGGA